MADKQRSILDDDTKKYRIMKATGGPDDSGKNENVLDSRLQSMVANEVKFLQEYGDEYFNSGGGMFSRLKMSLGDSNQGKRLFIEMRKANNQMGGDYTNEQLLDMANKGIKDAGLEYIISNDVLPKVKKSHGGKPLPNEGLKKLHSEEPDLVARMLKQDGGMMTSDDEMEEDYMQFIIDKALTEEEEMMLMSRLEQDMELSILFDKVVDVAQEFAGSGPVEGPGSGVSDSIPARLSDGEFVFTAKAVEEIGSDNLMSMMKEAEAKADERQQVATGGVLDSGEEEIDENIQRQTVVLDRGFVPEEDDMVDDEIKKRMMDPSTQSRYVRS